MSMTQEIFSYADQGKVAILLTVLLESRGQFSVSPFPQGVKDVQEGWIVTYPRKLASRANAMPEKAPEPPPEPSNQPDPAPTTACA